MLFFICLVKKKKKKRVAACEKDNCFLEGRIYLLIYKHLFHAHHHSNWGLKSVCFAEEDCKYCSDPKPELLYESAVLHLVEAQLVPAKPSWPLPSATICIPVVASMVETGS